MPPPEGYAVYSSAPPEVVRWAFELVGQVGSVPWGHVWSETFDGRAIVARKDPHTETTRDGVRLAGCFQGITVYFPTSADARPPPSHDEPGPDAVSVEDVLELVPRIPAECGLYVTPGCPRGALGHYERGPDVRAIARAISRHARDRGEAARSLVFAAYESGMDRHAKGDSKGGVFHSHGPWQLADVSEDVAEDPDRAIVVWLAMARDAETRCAQNAPDERLAVLASGHCDKGQKKVRVRLHVVRDLLSTW